MILARLRRLDPSQRGLSAVGSNLAALLLSLLLLLLHLFRACFQDPFLTARSGEESFDNIWPFH
jgi:hypothetical protein